MANLIFYMRRSFKERAATDMDIDEKLFASYVGGQLDVACPTEGYRCVGEVSEIKVDGSEVRVDFEWRAIFREGEWVDIDELQCTFRLNEYLLSRLKSLGEEYLVFTRIHESRYLTFISKQSREQLDPRVISRPVS